ncbi:structural maintenance of chromosomes protein 2-like [Littorina saxatilis]|uniref:Structural maintenance of chromosomes protein n=1 Tax=Littorina saxatilis TaxID=31220 RepID=A0AAN9GAR8_9CAEN
MHIKSIVIDGFKSYAQRTEINGFDPLFNAITGLNGSGKSNILDAICFLLGITNLTHVRATNLQELVYKNGQAGVTKATVSITFENLDKKQSPLGYESYDEIVVSRQVVIGGRNKYLINGSNANNNRVQDLFRSVQLNVNNPHFLIMQGRITKVLNMKPPEILSMIEEAAGTRLYETKREAAQRTIEKKDAKLGEIDTVLKEDISPTLTKLRDERSSYLEYQQILRELEHLSKLYVAYQFVCAQEKKKRSAEELVEMQELITTTQERMEEIKVKVGELDEKIAELTKRRDEESGGVMKELETAVADLQKKDATAQSALDNCREGLKAEEKKKKELIKNQQDNEKTVATRQKDLEKMAQRIQEVKDASKKDAADYTAAQKHFQAVSSGLSANADGEAATLNEQLLAAKNEISTAETNTKQAQMRLKHAEGEIKKKQGDVKKTDQDYKKDQSSHTALTQNLKKLENEMTKLGYNKERDEELQAQQKQLHKDMREIRDKLDTLEARFPQLRFDYSDPEKNFDRRRVHGLVCKLVQVKDTRNATALEVTAGGKLYNVVVDTEMTGKKLLQKGELKRRYTIIPLNKIGARAIDDATTKHAQQLVGKDNVHTALSLIGYKPDLEAAMKFVFGSAFICPDMDTAKAVAYDGKIQKRTVTLDGNSFDPAGTLTGGARAQTSSILEKLSEFQASQEELDAKQQQLAAAERELAALRKSADKYEQLKQQYDVKSMEADLVKTRLEQSSHHQQLEEINALQKSIEEQKKVLEEAKAVQEKATKKAKELEELMKNAGAVRERELQEAEKEMSTSKKRMEASSKKAREIVQEEDTIRLDLEELGKEAGNYGNQVDAVEQAIEKAKETVANLQEEATQTKDKVKAAQGELNKQKDLLKARNKDITAAATEQRALQKESSASQLKIQELQHKVTKGRQDSQDAARQVTLLLEKYNWIAEECPQFGKPNTPFDFTVNCPKEAEKRIQKLTETKDKLSKNVNMRAMNLLGSAEEQYADLLKKRKIVLNDKAKIQAVIDELDKKKNEALKKAWEQVNKDFGSIFSTLLPGTQAKLAPPEGQSVLDGLEVKVAFGDVWKETLSELSGGQRSLVALSLILAMLLFKPAPLYILDEVDAALDLSHTQNIGQMIRSHFKHSQFIVVSLKDGMFNNANVLFKTKFVDGVSQVDRYMQQQASRQPSTAAADKENEGFARKKAGPSSKKARVGSAAS